MNHFVFSSVILIFFEYARDEIWNDSLKLAVFSNLNSLFMFWLTANKHDWHVQIPFWKKNECFNFTCKSPRAVSHQDFILWTWHAISIETDSIDNWMGFKIPLFSFYNQTSCEFVLDSVSFLFLEKRTLTTKIKIQKTNFGVRMILGEATHCRDNNCYDCEFVLTFFFSQSLHIFILQ